MVATSPAAAHLWGTGRLSFSCLHELQVTIFTGHYIRYTYRVGPSFALRNCLNSPNSPKLIKSGDKQIVNMLVICLGFVCFFVFLLVSLAQMYAFW